MHLLPDKHVSSIKKKYYLPRVKSRSDTLLERTLRNQNGRVGAWARSAGEHSAETARTGVLRAGKISPYR